MILFGVLVWMLWNQFNKVNFSDCMNVSIRRPAYLIIGFGFVFFNWFFEWKKWNVTLKVIGVEKDNKVFFKSFMAGIVTGLLTPNMLGNFIGRMYYFQRRHRVSIILLTLLSNFTQFFASIFFGFLSLLFLGKLPFSANWIFAIFLVGLLTFVSLLFYFFFENFQFSFIKKMKIYQKMIGFIDGKQSFRWKFLIYSILRHFVFTLQFWLLLNSFVDAENFSSFMWIWQIFLWTTLIPSLWFGKLLIRESIALLVLTSLGYPQIEVLISSVLLWMINLALPSFVSLFVCNRKENRV